ncbi:EF-hand calcium-binding domain-containing protein 5-like isoform X2 [Physella acuta]|uniref:EF-hand calcium-binding domain-containing protein 5-like isoform X2 n=1 Tax=Physella acuta TaxID=109671 RepID=UPI0027DD1B7F|nr:EF-hand calcium-binding domain-containing protein 5-like isoform X2 [Physella acuta]
MEDDFDYNDTAQKPATQQEFLMENLCGKKGQSAGGYSAPAPRSASKRWKNIFEQNIMLKLDEKHAVKKQNVQLSKEAAREIIRKIPVELLAKEWLSKEDATVDMRAYLVDNVLPTLVLGVERLLKEVDEKGLSATNRFEPEFNPINYLAQYLMRNNPRFSNFAEASPYVRGLREVSEEIKQELFTFEDNRLARIKAEARRKRAEREKHEQQLMEARENRKEQLITQFQQWNIPTDNNRVPLCLIQNALRSFVELVDQWPTELREAARFGCPLDPTDETGITLSVDDFAQYISKFVQDFSMDVFEEFMLQMSKCAAIHRSASERENRRVILTNLFLMCDHGGLGLLDRLRILQIMEEFWDDIMNDGELKGTLRNPRRWPVIEVEEIDDSMFDAWEHEPDGGLTMNEIFQAENDLARINQEVHRSATIASVHDKTAMEKWKIKQLSEKSEGNEAVEGIDEETVDAETADGKDEGSSPPEEEAEAASDKETEEEIPVKNSEDSRGAENKLVEESQSDLQENEEAQRIGDEEVNKEEDEVTKDEEEKRDLEKIDENVDEVAVASTSEVVADTAASDEQTEKERAAQEIEEKETDELATQFDGDVLATGDDVDKMAATAVSDQEEVGVKQGEEQNENIEPAETHAEGSRKLEDFNSFNEASKSEKSKLSINSTSDIDRRGVTTNQRSQSQLSAFNENFLNMSQFVHLIETYLGNEPSRDTFEKIVKKIRDCYVDTEEEKMERMMLGRREMISAKRKLTIDNLFEKWDNDGSGFLEMEEVQEVLFKYKDGQELDGIKKAQAQLRKKYKYQDQRLSKSEFRDLIELAVKEMPGAENFEQLVEFLLNSVERSYAERIRGEARKKWLKQIVASSHYCGTQLDPVYKAVFQALYKDAETHGGEKRISANISMLEANKLDASRGKMLLRYAACTPEDCPYMLGKALFKNMKGVSFQAVESGKPVHVPRVSNHGSIYFWNYNRTQEEREGSFVAVPIKDSKKRVFGILGIDTICDPNKKSIFITHEIQFFQGVAKAFSIAFHAVELRRKLVRVFECASAWIARRCKYISEIDVYLVEPNMKPEGDPVLRKLLVIDKKGNVSQLTETHRLERKDNLFRSYLFQCMENSETIVADIYGERHTALPLRNLEGLALGIIDINIGEMKKLPPHENKEIQRMLRLLQKSLKEILKEGKGEDRKKILDIEKEDEASRINILFDSLMLAELRENVAKLDPMSFAELRSYITPPRVITDIIRATLAVFDVEKTGEGQYDDWHTMKNCINTTLVHQIKTYDPTKVSEATKIDKISRYLKALPHGEIGKYGSIPAMLMYNWVFCIHSIIDYTLKLRDAGHQAPSKTESRVNAN